MTRPGEGRVTTPTCGQRCAKPATPPRLLDGIARDAPPLMNGGPAALARHFGAVTDEIPRSAQSCFSSMNGEAWPAFVGCTRASGTVCRPSGTELVPEASREFVVSSCQSRRVAMLELWPETSSRSSTINVARDSRTRREPYS